MYIRTALTHFWRAVPWNNFTDPSRKYTWEQAHHTTIMLYAGRTSYQPPVPWNGITAPAGDCCTPEQLPRFIEMACARTISNWPPVPENGATTPPGDCTPEQLPASSRWCTLEQFPTGHPYPRTKPPPRLIVRVGTYHWPPMHTTNGLFKKTIQDGTTVKPVVTHTCNSP
ncbi:hypothetical protein BDZ94DRAFT_1370683 [Collybia nuda]|uniref:Uncharacterized protein n=1 Tax=Collybia nuda TaxID=64659 RepID=A0A9P5Y3N5_9AGAR|nr:hypothetical protein BDZ94DRAFT_1370683 [Collybia nuda]